MTTKAKEVADGGAGGSDDAVTVIQNRINALELELAEIRKGKGADSDAIKTLKAEIETLRAEKKKLAEEGEGNEGADAEEDVEYGFFG